MNGHKITPRQLQMLQLLDAGKSNGEIAEQLQISEHTVKVHLWRLFKGMGVTSRGKALSVWKASLGVPQLLTDDRINDIAAEFSDATERGFIFNRDGQFSAVAFARAVIEANSTARSAA